MAKLLDIRPEDFAHLTDEGQLAMKRLVYQKKFQEGILDMRAAVGITDFPMVKLEDLIGNAPQREDIDSQSLTEEIDRFCEDMDLPLLPWLNCIYCLAAYNKITCIMAINRASGEIYTPTEEELKELDEMYKQDDPKASLSEFLLYQSDSLHVSTDKGDVVMRIAPDAQQKEIKKVLKGIDETRKFFRGKKYGEKRTDYLDMANEAMYLQERKKLTDIQIAQVFHEQYRREETPAGVRKMIERAKEIGF